MFPPTKISNLLTRSLTPPCVEKPRAFWHLYVCDNNDPEFNNLLCELLHRYSFNSVEKIVFYDIQLHYPKGHTSGAQILFINPHCLDIKREEIMRIARSYNPNLIIILLTDEPATDQLLIDLPDSYGNQILDFLEHGLRDEDGRISKSDALNLNELNELFQKLEEMGKKAERAKAAQAHNESERERTESPHRKY